MMALTPYTHNSLVKFGPEGFEELHLSRDLDSFDDAKAAVQREEPVLLIYHGTVDQHLTKCLEGQPRFYVLLISSNPSSLRWDSKGSADGRVYALPWPWPDLQQGERWCDRPRWQRDRLTVFVEHIRQPGTERPSWNLLLPPKVPEYVLARYLCSIAGVPVDDAWKAEFEREVAEWGGTVTWEGDRSDGPSLREFLVHTGTLLAHSARSH